MPQHIEVGVVIVFDGPLMLVNERPPGAYFEGWWEWPGGKREPGESIEACALRELREEIGIEVTGLRVYDSRVVAYPGREVALTFFVARLAAGSKPHDTALKHRWLRPAEVNELKFLEPNQPVLKRLIAEPPFQPE